MKVSDIQNDIVVGDTAITGTVIASMTTDEHASSPPFVLDSDTVYLGLIGSAQNNSSGFMLKVNAPEGSTTVARVIAATSDGSPVGSVESPVVLIERSPDENSYVVFPAEYVTLDYHNEYGFNFTLELSSTLNGETTTKTYDLNGLYPTNVEPEQDNNDDVVTP